MSAHINVAIPAVLGLKCFLTLLNHQVQHVQYNPGLQQQPNQIYPPEWQHEQGALSKSNPPPGVTPGVTTPQYPQLPSTESQGSPPGIF